MQQEALIKKKVNWFTIVQVPVYNYVAYYTLNVLL